MSFGGPQWPQEPHQQNNGGYGHDPYGQQPPYGEQPSYGQHNPPYSGPQQPYGAQQPPPLSPSPSPFDPASGSGTPDWGALAEASAARQRRKRWLFAGVGVLATAAIASGVAYAVISTNKSADDKAAGTTGSSLPAPPGGAELPSDTTGPQPSFSSVAPPPPPNPMDFISTAEKDKAPLTADGLFPGKKLTVGDRVYRKGATSSTTNCASVGKDGLGTVLTQHGCTRVIRATYEKDGVAVTVGVALFADQAAALKAKDAARGGIAPLAGDGIGDFCRATVCLRRSNALGRYAYFTQAGFTDGRKVTKSDTAVFKTSDDLGTFAFNQIYARGRAQASAAATAPAAGGQ
ncbi:hypothetical protein [Streptomyces sp. TRM64462]|uniref:hypothetical protein n=1 Tax=Streptomyces sp. TRM64462 TaxID=2741726 RepID=UPI001586B23F|nr:hypothetical protein [Streptomyces sp. TRM64462]